jgi:hypothetical protein
VILKPDPKNKWLILISKKKALKNYNNPEDFDLTCFVYYYNDIGIRVFICPPSGVLSVFNGHVFTLYRERMNNRIDELKRQQSIEPLHLKKIKLRHC